MRSVKFLSFLWLLPFLFSGSISLAQGKQIGLLWEIKGNGLKKPSYIYGTIHLQSKRVFQYGKIVEKKLKSCEAFAPELIMDEIDQTQLLQKMLMPDNRIDQLLSPEEYQKVDSFMKKELGIGLDNFNNLKPFALMAQLGQSDSPGEMPVPLDMHLLELARKYKLKTFGVETLEEQLAVIDALPLKEQAKMLVQIVEDTAQGTARFEELVQTYLNQDLSAMMALAEDPTLPKEIQQQFINARNLVMADRIAKFVRERSTFVAVGAAHLGGKQGVIELLKAKGFEIKAVPFTFKN